MSEAPEAPVSQEEGTVFTLKVMNRLGHETLNFGNYDEAISEIQRRTKSGLMLFVDHKYVGPNDVSAAVRSGREAILSPALTGGSDVSPAFAELAANVGYRTSLFQCKTRVERAGFVKALGLGEDVTEKMLAAVEKKTAPKRAVPLDPSGAQARLDDIAQMSDSGAKRIFAVNAIYDGDAKTLGLSVYAYCKQADAPYESVRKILQANNFNFDSIKAAAPVATTADRSFTAKKQGTTRASVGVTVAEATTSLNELAHSNLPSKVKLDRIAANIKAGHHAVLGRTPFQYCTDAGSGGSFKSVKNRLES